MMQHQVLNSMHEKHVLGPVVETGLHDHINEYHTRDEADNAADTGSLPGRGPVQAAQVGNQPTEAQHQGSRGEFIGQKKIGGKYHVISALDKKILYILNGIYRNCPIWLLI